MGPISRARYNRGVASAARGLPLTTFSPTPNQLADALDEIAYEIEQLIGICFQLIQHGPGPEEATTDNQEAILDSNVYLEAFLLHVRVLLDFFEYSKRSASVTGN